jgi:hypothetical protein
MLLSNIVNYPVSPLLQEDLTPKEYLELYKDAPGIIKETRIIPAKLGEAGFGRIRVRYHYPYYGRILSRLKANAKRSAT